MGQALVFPLFSKMPLNRTPRMISPEDRHASGKIRTRKACATALPLGPAPTIGKEVQPEGACCGAHSRYIVALLQWPPPSSFYDY